MRLEAIAAAADPIHARVMYAIILIGFSAALGGACLAWVLARTMVDPLRRLEHAMEEVRRGDLDVRVAVGSNDEIGALELGFNEMTEKIAQSYHALETKNRELAEALDKLAYLEAVKRGLDRFVPDTVRRLIEAKSFVAFVGPSASGKTTVPQGYNDVQTRLSALIRRNASLGICGSCMDARGISEAELVEGAHRSSMEELTNWTLDVDKVITF